MKQNPLYGIKNIIFDLGGVIIDIDHHRTADKFKDFGFPDFIEHFSHSKQHEMFNLHEKGLITDAEFRKLVCSELKISVSEDVFDDAWNAILIGIPAERIELILELKKKYRIFMLSNTNSIHMIWMNNYLKDEFKFNSYKDIFEKAYFSFELGMRKPDADIFDFVLKDSGLNPSETLFIEDTLKNIEAAEMVGIKTLLISIDKSIIDYL